MNDTNHAPFVSIIVLNYNGEEIVGGCLEKLLEQTYSNFEIIVVDNNSQDSSIKIIEKYLKESNRLKFIRSDKNLGCPGGRNLGLKHAKGDIIAFIDNDGFADRDWVTNVVRALNGRPEVGAVASTVFFYRRKGILNGAGGKMNKSGYGKDICFNEPFEFAELPDEVLYAMGCGLVCKKEVLDQVGEFDAHLFNYYDDADFCLRIWKRGYKIILAKDASIWHKFNYSNIFNKNKGFLTERNRIRTVLKHFPLRLLLPWFLKEIFHELSHPDLLGIFVKAWIWNINNLQSLCKQRKLYGSSDGKYLNNLENRWGYNIGEPNNLIFNPNIEDAGNELKMGSKDECHYLNYGWYNLEKDFRNGISFRWSFQIASIIFRIPSKCTKILFKYRLNPGVEKVEVIIRNYKYRKEITSFFIFQEGKMFKWHEDRYDVSLTKGEYEMILKVTKSKEIQKRLDRTIGIALSSVIFA